ncbi:MarR family winged helix-turn-helix transcriptional regulator [Streptomyces sp. NPDC057074]|uniref:MarR family winged helix-turn-helix transcriptional regulator n=1 Tax=Streptomyces sp. NPDC057074 TaxID=3346015 RepID=UPI00363FDCE5
MTAPDAAADRTCHEAIRSVGGITELLDVLWEHARNATDGGTTPTSTSQLRLMYIADRADGIRMRTVCQLLASAPSTVTRMCDRLQAVGFLERLPCPGNGREVILRLTPAGTRHLLRIREQRDRVLHRAISNMPSAERHALATGLAALQAGLTTAHGDEDATQAAHSAA